MRKQGLFLATVFFLHAAFSSGLGSEVTLREVEDRQAPADIGESIRKTLRPGSVQLIEGEKVIFEFWFRSDLPLKARPASASRALQSISESSLLGVAVVGEGQRDYKDNEIAAGVYTMRFSLIPQDGDHMGVSEYPYYAVLILASNDPDLDGIKTYRAMVRASGKPTPTDHPVVLSLRPAPEASQTPQIVEPAPEHKSLRIKLSAGEQGSDQKAEVGLDIVFEGRYPG
jgi:hypothetical protein